MVQTEEHYTAVKIAWGKGNTPMIIVGRHQFLPSAMDRILNNKKTENVNTTVSQQELTEQSTKQQQNTFLSMAPGAFSRKAYKGLKSYKARYLATLE